MWSAYAETRLALCLERDRLARLAQTIQRETGERTVAHAEVCVRHPQCLGSRDIRSSRIASSPAARLAIS